MTYLMIAGGLVVLLFGGDIMVRGAVALAQRLDVPPLIIGLTVVAFGTSSPELVVSLKAALSGVPEMALGNVVGSNICNVLLVLGVPALVFPLTSGTGGVRRDGAIMVAASVLFIALGLTGEFTLAGGAVMLACLLAYLVWSYRVAVSGGGEAEDLLDELQELGAPNAGLGRSIAAIVGGLVALVGGSWLLVEGAVTIARDFGVEEEVIGLTILALGTSLPELATSLVAAIRKHGDVAVGNVIGSNLFNILGILGITAMVRTVPVPEQFVRFDFWLMLASAVLLLLFILRGASIGRFAGTVLTAFYALYIWSLFAGVAGMSGQAQV